MELRTNCKNCGAPLTYHKTDYGKTTKCKYCRQEYHIDLLGRVEEYKVKLEFMGEIKDFYIAEWEIQKIYGDAYRNIEGNLITSKPIKKIKLSLIEY